MRKCQIISRMAFRFKCRSDMFELSLLVDYVCSFTLPHFVYYSSTARFYFADEDIVILSLNGLSPEYNTFRCVIRGRENVITLKEFRSQLLAKEAIVENSSTAPFVTSMVASNNSNASKGSSFSSSSFNPASSQSNFISKGYKPYNGSMNKGMGRVNQDSRSFTPKKIYHTQTHVLSTQHPRVLG